LPGPRLGRIPKVSRALVASGAYRGEARESSRGAIGDRSMTNSSASRLSVGFGPTRPTTPPWSRSTARANACANAAPTPLATQTRRAGTVNRTLMTDGAGLVGCARRASPSSGAPFDSRSGALFGSVDTARRQRESARSCASGRILIAPSHRPCETERDDGWLLLDRNSSSNESLDRHSPARHHRTTSRHVRPMGKVPPSTSQGIIE
jgi:hypothetical protein